MSGPRSARAADEDRARVVVALPREVPPMVAVRATLVIASQRNIRAAGLFAAYREALTRAEAEALAHAVVGDWTDAALADAHYRACDQLPLTPADYYAFGRRLFDGTGGMLLGTAARVATSLGATPWLLFGEVGRFWKRAYRGSAIGVCQLGPREARVDIRGMRLVARPCYRYAFRGFSAAFVGLLCERCFVTELPDEADDASRSFRVAWG